MRTSRRGSAKASEERSRETRAMRRDTVDLQWGERESGALSAPPDVLGEAEHVCEHAGGSDVAAGAGPADDERVVPVARGGEGDQGLGPTQRHRGVASLDR